MRHNVRQGETDMTIQNENNSSELIDIKAETAKNEAAIASVIKDSPGMSSFFGGGGGGSDTEYGGATTPGATRQSSEVEHFMTAGVSAGGKKAEMAKQGMEVLFDSGSKGQSMFFSGGKKGGSFNISYAGEKGAAQKGPVKQQGTPLVDPGYFAKSKQARKGGGNAVDKNHVIAANVTAAGNAVSGKSYGHKGSTFTPTITQPTPDMVRQLSHLCHTLLQDKNTLHQLENGAMSRNRLIRDLQDGKEGAEQQLRTMTGGQKVEAFRNMAPSVKQDILDGPGT